MKENARFILKFQRLCGKSLILINFLTITHDDSIIINRKILYIIRIFILICMYGSEESPFALYNLKNMYFVPIPS